MLKPRRSSPAIGAQTILAPNQVFITPVNRTRLLVTKQSNDTTKSNEILWICAQAIRRDDERDIRACTLRDDSNTWVKTIGKGHVPTDEVRDGFGIDEWHRHEVNDKS